VAFPGKRSSHHEQQTAYPVGAGADHRREVVDLLSPVCERIEVAGSVRREKAFVGDIEILCAPRVRHETQMDLFGQATGPTCF
jgi:DNA polymerase/3'-5' exonuclease PolX